MLCVDSIAQPGTVSSQSDHKSRSRRTVLKAKTNRTHTLTDQLCVRATKHSTNSHPSTQRRVPYCARSLISVSLSRATYENRARSRIESCPCVFVCVCVRAVSSLRGILTNCARSQQAHDRRVGHCVTRTRTSQYTRTILGAASSESADRLCVINVLRVAPDASNHLPRQYGEEHQRFNYHRSDEGRLCGQRNLQHGQRSASG